MPKRARITSIVLALILIFNAQSLSAEYLVFPVLKPIYPQFQYVNNQLWGYLRQGLNYLESPKPDSPPEKVPPSYIHPDARGFGAYGLSPEAYADVQRLYPFFKEHLWQNILESGQLYELANQAFADWLLKNLQDYLPSGATEKQIFDVIQQAWNLGLSGFKNGNLVVASRMSRAEEFKAGW